MMTTAQAARDPLAKPGWMRMLRDFHAYHGVWALGVRLLRRWSIQAKVLLLLAIVALPTAPLTVYLLRGLNDEVTMTRQQLAAVRLADAASSLGTELTLQSLAQQAGRSVNFDRMGSRHDKFQAALAEARLPHALPGTWQAGERVVARAVRERGLTAAERNELTAAASKALLDLRGSVAVADQISNGPDVRINRSARLAVRTVPDLQVTVGHLRHLAARHQQLRSAQERPAAAIHDLLVEAAGRAQMAAHLSQVVEGELAALHIEAARAARSMPRTHELLKVLKGSVLAADPIDDGPAVAAKAEQAREELARLRDELVGEAASHLQQRLHDASQQQQRVLTLLAICLLLVAYLGYAFFLVMRGGLMALNVQMNRMAAGDFSARMVPLGGDEVAQTMRAMTNSLAGLSDLLATVRNGVGSVTQAAEQVAMGNGQLTERNRAAAQGLQGVVDSVLRYTSQLEACGRQVESVVATVQELRLDAMRNRKQTQRLQEQMTSLRTRSREIGEIVRLIDGIAFRTNILSLNAQVEACKAGEAGRGFAVVAQEVRSLALRSADSARRIDQIVGRSTEEIERSGQLADETGRALQAVDQHVDRIHAAMHDVATLTRNGEQESALILSEVKQLQDGSGKNQELVDQLAAAAGSLRSQGLKLAQSVGQFTLA